VILLAITHIHMKLDIIYEDSDIILVNKPADLLTIPDRHDAEKPSLQGALKAHYGRVFTIHRLDRETSGILIFAKNEDAHRHLSIQFEKHETSKIYVALLDGVLHQDTGEIDKPIATHSSVAGKMVIAKRGKESLTYYKATEKFKHFTLVEADIRTGRTHQVRVHFQSIGYPLAVDALYGRRNSLLLSAIKTKGVKLGKFEEERPIMSRTTLHAHRLTFKHPTTLEMMSFEAPIPKDFTALLNQLRKWGSK
jgi:23S rRNA pseudouridine1911/1915/1917 synthase